MKSILALMIAVSLSACSEKNSPAVSDTLTPVQQCMKNDSNPFLVQIRKQAADPANVSAQYVLKATCEEMAK